MNTVLEFPYGEKEIEYLKSKDKRLAFVIDRVGHISRECHKDLFSAIVHSIVGQQISTKAQISVWKKFTETVKTVSPSSIINAGRDNIQKIGISYKKADYIIEFAQKVNNGSIDLNKLKSQSDETVINELVKLNGVGVWTAEMMLLFCLQRPNILSFSDFAIQRGMRMVFRHRKIDKKLFEKYRNKLSPYCSVASLYFWEVSSGAIPELTDPMPIKKNVRKKRVVK